MVRHVLTAVVALVSVVGVVPSVEAQSTEQRRHRPRPRPTPPQTPAPRPPGGNDAGGDSNVRPGSIAPRSNMGIGVPQSRPIETTPPIIIQPYPLPRPHPHPHWDDWDRSGYWRYRRERDRYDRRRYWDRHDRVYYPLLPRDPFMTIGTGLAIGGYGYTGAIAYPAATLGLMHLPAPAIAYDSATGTYVYGYANPYGPALVPAGAVAALPVSVPVEPARPATPLTPMERALDRMQLGETDQAITELRTHLAKEPDDARAQRVLALALLEKGRLDDGVATLRQAYRTDPGLANDPIDREELGYSESGLRTLVTRAVTYANRVDSGSAWLTVAALMQAEGRTEQARNSLEKARRNGLEADLLGAMKAALQS